MRLPGVFRTPPAGWAGHGRFGFALRQRVRRSGREPHDSRAAQPHHKGQNPCQYARKRYAVTGGRRENHPALSGLGRKVASPSCRRPRWTHVHPHQFRALRHHIWSLLHDEGRTRPFARTRRYLDGRRGSACRDDRFQQLFGISVAGRSPALNKTLQQKVFRLSNSDRRSAAPPVAGPNARMRNPARASLSPCLAAACGSLRRGLPR